MDRNGYTIPLEKALEVEQISSHEYRGHFTSEWSLGEIAHGGFVTSLAQSAVKKHFDTTHAKLRQNATLAVHIDWLKNISIGEASIVIKDLRIGKSSSTVQAMVVSEGEEKALVIVSKFNSIKASKGLSAPERGQTLAEYVRPIDFEAILPNTDKNWFRLDNLRVAGRPNHAVTNHIYAIPRQRVTNGDCIVWLRHRNPEDSWTTEQIGLLLDHNIPPMQGYYEPQEDGHSVNEFIARAEKFEQQGKSTYDHPPWAGPHWYATLNMTIDFKRQVKDGEKWLLLRGETKELIDGHFDILAEVWSASGEMIAIAQSQWSTGEYPPAVLKLVRRVMGYKDEESKL